MMKSPDYNRTTSTLVASVTAGVSTTANSDSFAAIVAATDVGAVNGAGDPAADHGPQQLAGDERHEQLHHDAADGAPRRRSGRRRRVRST